MFELSDISYSIAYSFIEYYKATENHFHNMNKKCKD